MNPCFLSILCALSGPIRNAIVGIINSSIAYFQAQIGALTAQLAVIDVLLAPTQAALDIAQAAVDAIRASASVLLPAVLIEGCVDVGEINVNADIALETALSELRQLQDKFRRQLARRNEIAAVIDDFNARIDRMNEALTALATCGT